MTKQYTQNDYIFLGKQVAEGKYVGYSTFILSLILALLIGTAIGRYVLPQGGFALPSAGSGAVEEEVSAGGGSVPNDMVESILRHEEEVRKDPNDPEAWAHLGNLYYDTGKAQQAINAYEKSLALKPGNTSVLVDCGVMYREIKNYEKALEYFAKALQISVIADLVGTKFDEKLVTVMTAFGMAFPALINGVDTSLNITPQSLPDLAAFLAGASVSGTNSLTAFSNELWTPSGVTYGDKTKISPSYQTIPTGVRTLKWGAIGLAGTFTVPSFQFKHCTIISNGAGIQ